MTSHWQPDHEAEHCAIQKYDGAPEQPSKTGERTRWQRFVQYVCPWLKEKGAEAVDLAARWGEAEVRGREATSEMQEQKVAELAAKADQEKHKGTKAFIDLVETAFPDQPERTDDLKMGKIFQDNPGLLDQITKIKAMQVELGLKYGTVIQVLTTPSPEVAEPVVAQLTGHAEIKFGDEAKLSSGGDVEDSSPPSPD